MQENNIAEIIYKNHNPSNLFDFPKKSRLSGSDLNVIYSFKYFFKCYTNLSKELLSKELQDKALQGKDWEGRNWDNSDDFFNKNPSEQINAINKAIDADINDDNKPFRKYGAITYKHSIFINLLNFFLYNYELFPNLDFFAFFLINEHCQPIGNIFSSIKFFDNFYEKIIEEVKEKAIKKIAEDMVENNQTEPSKKIMFLHDENIMQTVKYIYDQIKNEKGTEFHSINRMSQLFDSSNKRNTKSIEPKNLDNQKEQNQEQQNEEKSIQEIIAEFEKKNNEMELDDLDDQSPESPLTKVQNATAQAVPTQKKESQI